MSKEDERIPLDDQIGLKTGITPQEKANAEAAQQAVEKMIIGGVNFVAAQMLQDRLTREEQETSEPIVLITPYGERELREAEKSIRNSGIELRNNVYEEFKPHLLSAMVFASQLGIDQQKVLQALANHIEKQRKEQAYLRQGITYELASYFVEEFIVKVLANKKHLTVPQSFKPEEERKTFMEKLANSLNDKEKEKLARYIASTITKFSISPFYFPVSFDVSNINPLRRQNIAIAITPQKLEKAQIEKFLAQKDIRKEMFLVVMANPHLWEIMPLGALLAKNYRVKVQYSPSDIREIPIKEALEEQIEKSYRERSIGNEPKGLLPFEELAGLLVIKGLSKLPNKDLDTEFARIVPEVLQAKKPLSKLEEKFPDMRLFFNDSEINQLAQNIETLKKALEQPDQVPPFNFWNSIFTKPNKLFDYLTTVKDRFIQMIYQEGEKTHLQRWQDVVKSFAVSVGQERNGQPLSLTFLNDHMIVVSDNEGPLFALIKREDGQYYPTSYWDKKTQKLTFDIAGRLYKELKQMIAASPFRYQVEGDYLREVIRGNFSELAARIYKQIKFQVDLKRLRSIDLYPSHAAIEHKEEGPLRDFQYLIGGMNPYEVETYKSILSAFVKHLWQHNKLSETDLSITVPLTGETITVRHPLLDLQRLSFEEIKKRLAETGVDVRMPEITIRKSGGYELRAKAWVYEALLMLKELGFDAVLGETMADEFNRQAVRIYVESVLKDLDFLPEKYQREEPLKTLKEKQQRIYSKALELNFTVSYNSYKLARSLSLPLTWEREEELWKYLKEKLSSEELQKFIKELKISDLDKYFETRIVFETFFNFASGWKWNQYDRSNEFPTYTLVFYQKNDPYQKKEKGGFVERGLGEFAISTQAQKRFEAAKKTWEQLLENIKEQSLSLDDSWQQRLSSVLDLAKDLVNQINMISQTKVTELAKKIIEGRMAAVGRDISKPIKVETWGDFYNAVEQLMNTARLVLIYRSEKGKFGWEVSTDKKESF